MTTFRTTCIRCGDIAIPLHQVYVNETTASYHFTHCQTWHERRGPIALDVLKVAGVLVVDLTKLDEEARALL